MIAGEDQRPWADICPDLLNSIYTRLPSHVDGTHFGGVCKNWHQIHSHFAVSNPLPEEISHTTRLYTSDIVQVWEGNRLYVQPCRKTQIPEWLLGLGAGGAKILGSAGTWLLLNKDDQFLCCYNPLLRSPANYIGLPNRSWNFSHYRFWDRTPVMVKAAFSALPTARDSMILMVYGDRYFSVLRCAGDWFWKPYNLCLGRRKKKGRQTCLGVGYRNGKFFALFEMGDMLIFSVHRNGTRILLVAAKPLLPEQLERWDSLRVVAVVAVGDMMGFTVVTHWERDHEASEKDSFRLVAVVEETAMTTTDLSLENSDDDDDDCEMVSVKDGNNNKRGLILVKDRLPLKRNFDQFYIVLLFLPCLWLCWIFGYLIAK